MFKGVLLHGLESALCPKLGSDVMNEDANFGTVYSSGRHGNSQNTYSARKENERCETNVSFLLKTSGSLIFFGTRHSFIPDGNIMR